jgi:plastocyanin
MNYGSAAAALVVCLLAACAPQESSGPNVVTVVASDFGYDLPDQIPAGVTTVRMVNEGSEPHHAVIAKIEAGKTVEELVEQYEAQNYWPDYVEYVGGPGETDPGDTAQVTLALEPGQYVLVCFVPSPDGVPHLMKGMTRLVEVIASDAEDASEPTPDVTVQLADFAFGFSGPITSGEVTFRVENAGPQVHDMVILRLEPGKTVADFLEWLEGGAQGAPAGRIVASITGMNAGRHVSFTAFLEPGDYSAICWVPDRADLRPHFMHGMVQDFTVS